MSGATRARRRSIRGGLAILLLAVGAGCDKPTALGNATQILVAADEELWAVIEADVRAALQPTSFTVRDEEVFDIAHASPAEPTWGNLRLNRQLLLIGHADDPSVAEAIDAAEGDVAAAPTYFQAQDVWARNQLVTVVLLPPGDEAAAARAILPRVGQTYLDQFEEYARARMFVTEPNEALADSLRRTEGFVLTLPQVYRHEIPEPGVHVFRNDQPDPSRLIRNLTVASRPRGEVPMTAEAAVAWRAELANRLTVPPQVTEPRPDLATVPETPGAAVQVQGIWSNPPDQWPAAGMYIARMIECPERVFLIDAWLYAPGVPKYEYAYQIKTLLDGFGCAPAA